MKHALSIITPVYNGKRFIEFCIKNVIEQNCPDAEHIIFDGGSTDGTVEIICKYTKKYPHIRWVSEKDRGQSDAMNKGIGMAAGSILGFLNVDDYYEPDALNYVVGRFATLPEPSLLVGNCNVWGNDGKIQGVNKPEHLSLTQLLVSDESRFPFPINPSAYFYHKSLHNIIGLYDIQEHYALDIDFILRAVRHANSYYVDRTLGNYRYIEGTKTFNDLQFGNGLQRFEDLLDRYREQLSWKDKLKVRYMSFLGRLARIPER